MLTHGGLGEDRVAPINREKRQTEQNGSTILVSVVIVTLLFRDFSEPCMSRGCIFATLAGLVLIVICGCNTRLETGYEPTKLGSMSPTERRGLYAEEFSPEARAAQEEAAKNKQTGFFNAGPSGGQ